MVVVEEGVVAEVEADESEWCHAQSFAIDLMLYHCDINMLAPLTLVFSALDHVIIVSRVCLARLKYNNVPLYNDTGH